MSDQDFNPRSLSAAIGSAIAMMTGSVAMVSATTSLFVKPWTASFGLDRSHVSLLMLIVPWTIALCAPLAGRAMDRWGVRRVLLPSIAAFAAAQLAVATLVHSAWQLAAMLVLIGMASVSHSALAYSKIISLWFAERRGLMLCLAVAVASGAGSVIMPQVLRPVIEQHGWRGANLTIAAIVLLVGLPAAALLVREPAGGQGRSAGRIDPATLEGLSLGQALRRPTFWLLAGSIFLFSMPVSGTVGHSFPLLTERGLAPAVAAGALSTYFAGGVIGQVASGLMMDRLHTPRIAIPLLLCALAGLAIFYAASSPAALMGGALLLGASNGAEHSLTAYFVSRYFGLKAYSAIYGLTYCAGSLSLGAGYLLMGVVHDRFGGYGPARPALLVSMILSIVLIALMGPYVYALKAKAPQSRTP